MEIFYKYMSIAIWALVSYFLPIKMLFLLVLIFLFLDFVTGVAKSRIMSKINKEKFIFSANKMAKSIVKFIIYATAILVAFMIDKEVVNFIVLNAANYICLYIVLVEVWSIIENCVVIFPESRFFSMFKSVVKTQLKKRIDIDDIQFEKPKVELKRKHNIKLKKLKPKTL